MIILRCIKNNRISHFCRKNNFFFCKFCTKFFLGNSVTTIVFRNYFQIKILYSNLKISWIIKSKNSWNYLTFVKLMLCGYKFYQMRTMDINNSTYNAKTNTGQGFVAEYKICHLFCFYALSRSLIFFFGIFHMHLLSFFLK